MAHYYHLKYPRTDGWVGTWGSEAARFPQGSDEDFSEQTRIINNLAAWSPGAPWTPQPITLHFEAQGRALEKTDRVFQNSVGPVFSQRAVVELKASVAHVGHFLPLEVLNHEEPLWLWWLPVVEGSVDEVRSTFFPNGKSIKKLVLNDDLVCGAIAFRPHYTTLHEPHIQGRVIVSEDFKQAWLSAGLTGIAFAPLSF